MRKKMLICLAILVAISCNLNSEIPGTGKRGNENPGREVIQVSATKQALESTSTPTFPDTLWVSPTIPTELGNAAVLAGFPLTSNYEMATIHLDLKMDDSERNETDTTWIYALVAPYPTLIDGIKMDDLKSSWAGEPSGSLLGVPVWMEISTHNAFSAIWGKPNPGFKIRLAPSEQLLDSAWKEQPSFAIIPFEDIEPRWKVLTIDDQSPIRKEFDPETYPLKITFSLSGETGQTLLINIPLINRDPEKMTTLVMTGVTALVRMTAEKMEKNGRTYPGEAIRDWLQNADLTHISNEVSFTPECPSPDRNQSTRYFCSDPRNIELLDFIGTDIVELTGNHFQDWGSEATLYTIDLYNQRGWMYFGGGVNWLDARKSITIENHGNKLGFIGCNPSGPTYAWATETEPGAARCDMDWMRAEVTRLKGEGFLPISTFQYFEGYGVWPGPDQIGDFRSMAEAGAVIVSGSQAHFPQTIEFHNGSFIHYGLGNLFFDQMDFPVVGTRREFMDRHVFYNGRYINTELLTAMLEDYSRPRPMMAEERRLFLHDIFEASGW
jgi:hypothetical protein